MNVPSKALSVLSRKVEKEIGQVWRQMGIMYGKVTNSLKMLEKVINVLFSLCG